MQKQEEQTLYKKIMGNYPSGVTIVTTTTETGDPVGLTVSSFASVSLDPLMVLWSIDHGVSSRHAFESAGKFAIHVLAEDQAELCKTFASRGVDRFSACNWKKSDKGLPIIDDVFGVFECDTFKAIEAGDDTVMIGAIKNLSINEEKEPMLYHRRVFGPVPEEFYKQTHPLS